MGEQQRIERIANLDFCVPRAVGQIKSGKNGPTHPEKLDHFILTTLRRENKEKGGNLALWPGLDERLGEKPTHLNVSFLYDRIEANAFTKYALWNPKLKCNECVGDGIRALQGVENKVEKACDPEKCPNNEKCKPSTILICTLRDVPEAGGPFIFFSRSWHTLRGIMYGLEWAKQQTGIIAGLPFTLSLHPKTVQLDTGMPSTVYFASLLPSLGIQELLQKATEIRRMRQELGINIEELEQATVQAMRDRADQIEQDNLESGEFESDEPDKFQQKPTEPSQTGEPVETEEEIKKKVKAAMSGLGFTRQQAIEYTEAAKRDGKTTTQMLAELNARAEAQRAS